MTEDPMTAPRALPDEAAPDQAFRTPRVSYNPNALTPDHRWMSVEVGGRVLFGASLGDVVELPAGYHLSRQAPDGACLADRQAASEADGAVAALYREASQAFDEGVEEVHRAFCDPEHEKVGEWDRSMADALRRRGLAIASVDDVANRLLAEDGWNVTLAKMDERRRWSTWASRYRARAARLLGVGDRAGDGGGRG